MKYFVVLIFFLCIPFGGICSEDVSVGSIHSILWALKDYLRLNHVDPTHTAEVCARYFGALAVSKRNNTLALEIEQLLVGAHLSPEFRTDVGTEQIAKVSRKCLHVLSAGTTEDAYIHSLDALNPCTGVEHVHDSKTRIYHVAGVLDNNDSLIFCISTYRYPPSAPAMGVMVGSNAVAFGSLNINCEKLTRRNRIPDVIDLLYRSYLCYALIPKPPSGKYNFSLLASNFAMAEPISLELTNDKIPPSVSFSLRNKYHHINTSFVEHRPLCSGETVSLDSGQWRLIRSDDTKNQFLEWHPGNCVLPRWADIPPDLDPASSPPTLKRVFVVGGSQASTLAACLTARWDGPRCMEYRLTANTPVTVGTGLTSFEVIYLPLTWLDTFSPSSAPYDHVISSLSDDSTKRVVVFALDRLSEEVLAHVRTLSDPPGSQPVLVAIDQLAGAVRSIGDFRVFWITPPGIFSSNLERKLWSHVNYAASRYEQEVVKVGSLLQSAFSFSLVANELCKEPIPQQSLAEGLTCGHVASNDEAIIPNLTKLVFLRIIDSTRSGSWYARAVNTGVRDTCSSAPPGGSKFVAHQNCPSLFPRLPRGTASLPSPNVSIADTLAHRTQSHDFTNPPIEREGITQPVDLVARVLAQFRASAAADVPVRLRHVASVGTRADWWVVDGVLGPESIVYSAGIADDTEFEKDIRKRTGAQVFAFDASPDAEAVMRQDANRILHYEPYMITSDGRNLTFVMEAMSSQEVNWASGDISGGTNEAQAKEFRSTSLTDAVRRLGHHWIDYLKLDIEGSEFEVLASLPPEFPICQLALEEHSRLVTSAHPLFAMHAAAAGPAQDEAAENAPEVKRGEISSEISSEARREGLSSGKATSKVSDDPGNEMLALTLQRLYDLGYRMVVQDPFEHEYLFVHPGHCEDIRRRFPRLPSFLGDS
eukprot:Rmarinus@m.25214